MLVHHQRTGHKFPAPFGTETAPEAWVSNTGLEEADALCHFVTATCSYTRRKVQSVGNGV